MKQDEKKEINNQEFRFIYKDWSVISPTSILPSILAALVSLIMFYGVFLTDKITPDSFWQAAIIVSGVVFALLATVLLFLSIKKNENEPDSEKNKYKPTTNQDGLRHLSDNIFVTSDQEILHNYIKDSFSSLKNGDEAFQTYIGAFPISSLRDLIEEASHDNNITVERLFGITSPYEINFLSASEEKKKSLFRETNGKHKINNRIFQIDLPDIGFKHISNLTLFNDFVLITFKTKKPSLFPESEFNLKKRFPPLFADNTTTLCLGIVGGEASKVIKSDYLNRITGHKPSSIDEIKRNMYETNPVEYLAAIGYSVAKEVSFLEEFNPYSLDNKGLDKLGYVGIVGSLAEILKNEEATKRKPHDIDLLFFISHESLPALPNIYNVAIEVAKRYSIDGLLNVIIDDEMRPRFDKANEKVSIQIIINDYLSPNNKSFVAAMKPSTFTMATRLHCNIPLFGSLSDFYPTQNIQYKDVLDENDCFSVTNFIKTVEDKKIYTRFWDQTLKVMKEESRSIDENEWQVLYKYCIKWGIINLFFASTESSQQYGISFNEIVSKIAPHFCIDDLKTNQLLTEKKCLNILKQIQKHAIEREDIFT